MSFTIETLPEQDWRAIFEATGRDYSTEYVDRVLALEKFAQAAPEEDKYRETLLRAHTALMELQGGPTPFSRLRRDYPAELRKMMGLPPETPLTDEEVETFLQSDRAPSVFQALNAARAVASQPPGTDIEAELAAYDRLGRELGSLDFSAQQITPLTPEFLNSLTQDPPRLESFFRYWFEKTQHGPAHYVAINPTNSQKFIINPTSDKYVMVYVVQENRLRVFSWKGGEPFDLRRADHTNTIFAYASHHICPPLAEFFLGKGRTHKEGKDTITQKARFGKNDYHTRYTKNGRTTEPVTRFITDGLTKEGFEEFERAENTAVVSTAPVTPPLPNITAEWLSSLKEGDHPNLFMIDGKPYLFFESESKPKWGGLLTTEDHGLKIVVLPIESKSNKSPNQAAAVMMQRVNRALAARLPLTQIDQDFIRNCRFELLNKEGIYETIQRGRTVRWSLRGYEIELFVQGDSGGEDFKGTLVLTTLKDVPKNTISSAALEGPISLDWFEALPQNHPAVFYVGYNKMVHFTSLDERGNIRSGILIRSQDGHELGFALIPMESTLGQGGEMSRAFRQKLDTLGKSDTPTIRRFEERELVDWIQSLDVETIYPISSSKYTINNQSIEVRDLVFKPVRSSVPRTPLTPEFLNSLHPERVGSFFRYWFEKTETGGIYQTYDSIKLGKVIFKDLNGTRPVAYLLKDGTVVTVTLIRLEATTLKVAQVVQDLEKHIATARHDLIPLELCFSQLGAVVPQSTGIPCNQKGRFVPGAYEIEGTSLQTGAKDVQRYDFDTSSLSVEGFLEFESAEKAAVVSATQSTPAHLPNISAEWLKSPEAKAHPDVFEFDGTTYMYVEGGVGGNLQMGLFATKNGKTLSFLSTEVLTLDETIKRATKMEQAISRAGLTSSFVKAVRRTHAGISTVRNHILNKAALNKEAFREFVRLSARLFCPLDASGRYISDEGILTYALSGRQILVHLKHLNGVNFTLRPPSEVVAPEGLQPPTAPAEFSVAWFQALQRGDPGVFEVQTDGGIQKFVYYEGTSDNPLDRPVSVLLTQFPGESELKFVTYMDREGSRERAFRILLETGPSRPLDGSNVLKILNLANSYPITRDGKPFLDGRPRLQKMPGSTDMVYYYSFEGGHLLLKIDHVEKGTQRILGSENYRFAAYVPATLRSYFEDKPVMGLKFERIENTALKTEGNSNFYLYENKEYGVGIALLIDPAQTPPLLQNVYLYNSEWGAVQTLQDLIKSMTFKIDLEATGQQTPLVGGAHFVSEDEMGKAFEATFESEGSLKVDILNPVIFSPDRRFLAQMSTLSFEGEKYDYLRPGTYTVMEKPPELPLEERSVVYRTFIGDELWHFVVFPDPFRVFFFPGDEPVERKIIEGEVINPPQKTGEGEVSILTAVLNGVRFTASFVSNLGNTPPILPRGGFVLLRTIKNYHVLLQKRGREKLREAVEAFNKLAPPRPSSSIPINWPGNSQSAQTPKKIADWKLVVSIQSGDPEAQTFRDVKLRLQKKEQKKFYVQWGEGGALSSYKVEYRDVQGTTEIFLVPEEGAPKGVIRLVQSPAGPTALQIHESGEILDNVYAGRYNFLSSLEYDSDSMTLILNFKMAEDFEEVMKAIAEILGRSSTIKVEEKPKEQRTRITHGINDYDLMVELVNELNQFCQENNPMSETISPWLENVEQYDISEAGLKLQVARITDYDGQIFFELRGGTLRGEEMIQRADTTLKIGDPLVEKWPVSIQPGETISLRQDTPSGWEDIQTLFAGDHLEQVEAKFVSRGSQTETLQVDTQVDSLSDQAFGLTLSVLRDYRTGKLVLEGASVTLKGDEEILIAMGIDPEETANLVTTVSVELADGIEIKFAYPSNNLGLGDITFTLQKKEGGGTANREKIPGEVITDLPAGIVVSFGNFNMNMPVETHVAVLGDGKTRYFVRRNGEGGVDYVKVLQAWGSLVGIPVPSLEEGVDLQVEITDAEGPDTIALDRGFIRFVPIKRNPDGTIPMEALYLKELEYQIIREAIEGASFKGAGRHELVMVDKSPRPFSMISQYQIRPGEIFLPTPDTLTWIRDIFRSTPPGASPFKKGERLEKRLEFESSEGLVISIPVKWMGRAGNPFGLDADGQFKLDSEGNIILENGIPVLEHGRRIETYIRGQSAATLRPVGYDFRAHEDNGFWTFYAMEHDPETGGKKAFNLSVALHQKSPVLMTLVDTRDDKGEETPESRMDARKSARCALDQRILDVFLGQDDLPNVFVIPHQLIETEGDRLQLAFVSETNSDSWTSVELRGFALDKTARRLDFEPELLLKLGRVDETGVTSTEEIRLQHAISRRDRVVILREILDGTRRGRTFVWNLMLGTLVEIRPPQSAVSEDDVLAIIRNNNLPILNKITPDTSEGIRRDKVKHKGGSYIELDHVAGIPVLPDRYLGFQMPLPKQIERIREGGKIGELFKKYPLHNQFFIPDEASVYAMMLVGRDEEYMTFMTHSGIVLQIPMKELPVFEAPPAVVAGSVTPTEIGARYVFDKEPDPVYGVKGARLLIPNRRDDSTVYSALVNHPYSSFDYGVRDYQKEAMEVFERSFTGRGMRGARDQEGTIVLPTGAGKTRLIVGSLALAVKHSSFKLGDKLIVTTHLKNITAQNVAAIVEDFAPLFKKLTGRDLTYNIIAGDETPNLSGDLLFVSIPKVTHRGAGRKRTYNFGQELKKALGDEGRVVLTAMDEIHHLRADTWQETRRDIVHASLSSYFLGLTATPSGHETNKLYERKPLELMRLGALPDINLVEVATGVSLDAIAPKTGVTFNSGELLSVINTTARNRLVMQSLEKYGIRVDNNPEALSPTLLFSHDIRHALDLAEAYANYFGKGRTYEGALRSHYRESYPLRGRKLEVIGTRLEGESYRSSTIADIERAIARKETGEIDALVAVVTGQMGDKAREKILEYWKAGIIEMVISDQAYGEGFDGWFLRNLVDADVTLSPTEKAQKGGRITRRGKGEVDTKTGRLLLEPRRVVIDMRDSLRRQGAQLQTFRNAYGYTHKTIPPGTLWNLKEEKPIDQVITHHEIEPIVVHPKRGGGVHHDNLELTIDLGGDEKMVVDLKQMGTEQNYGNKEVFGFHSADKKRATPQKSPNAQAELKEWIEYLNMHTNPRLISTGSVSTGSVMEKGRNQILLSDGGKLDLEVSKIGDGEYKLSGVQTHAGRGELPPRALLTYTDGIGHQTPYEVYLPPNESSLLLLRHPETGKWQVAFVDRDGHFCLTDRRDYIDEFLTHRASGNFPMVKIIGGEEYASHARSVVTRRPLLTRETASKTFEITAVLGRQEGTSAVSLMGGSEGDKPHIRFVVSEREDGELFVERGEIKESDQGSYFPFGDDFEIDIVEDKWLDARTNALHRGRVRIVFSQKELIVQEGGKEAKLKPYGWIEFESRQQLVGESAKFTVQKAHYHETSHYQKRKLMPQADQFLIYGAGHLIGELLFKGGKFVGQGLFDEELMRDKLGDFADEAFELLSGTKGAKEDVPHLLRVLSLLTFVNYQALVPEVGEELISEDGGYKEEVLAELAHFAKTPRSPPTENREVLTKDEILPGEEEEGGEEGAGNDEVGPSIDGYSDGVLEGQPLNATLAHGGSLLSSNPFLTLQPARGLAVRNVFFQPG